MVSSFSFGVDEYQSEFRAPMQTPPPPPWEENYIVFSRVGEENGRAYGRIRVL